MNKERREAARQMIDAYTPWQDKFKAWCVKWATIAGFIVLLWMLIEAYN